MFVRMKIDESLITLNFQKLYSELMITFMKYSDKPNNKTKT